MVIDARPARPTTSLPTRSLRRGWTLLRRRTRSTDAAVAVLLCVASVLIGVAQYALPVVPLTTLAVPMVIANLVLGPRVMPWALIFIITVLLVVVAATPKLLDGRRVGGVLALLLIGIIVLVASMRRGRLGLAGSRGESILVDLRDRIQSQARVPELPEGWYADAVLRSAGGSSFAGDFLVAARSRDGRVLQVAVVDVSGKGEQAGSRSLLLSGAFGGLLSALPAAEFLSAANDYLLRQDWDEGFATAVHLTIDLEEGGFALRSAGHPPAAQLCAGSGRWLVHQADGPVLGLMPDAEFTVVHGTLQAGDALLLFTDGMVETPSREISMGVDRLLGAGEQLLRTGFEGGAHRLLDRLDVVDDDQALLLLHRR